MIKTIDGVTIDSKYYPEIGFKKTNFGVKFWFFDVENNIIKWMEVSNIAEVIVDGPNWVVEEWESRQDD